MRCLMDLEDELGDVLEKAMKMRGLTEDELARRAGVTVRQIKDALDYRDEFSESELHALARALDLNEVGFLALAGRRYPAVTPPRLPYCLKPLSLSFGVGTVNAYLVRGSGAREGLLFDTGYTAGEVSLRLAELKVEPRAVFLTHGDRDHLGGLAELRRRFPAIPVYGPGAEVGARSLKDGEELDFAPFKIRYLDTCGHSDRHGSYLLQWSGNPAAVPVLIGGDLIFAGSIGGAFHCRHRLLENVHRVLRELPGETLLAPGHGPLTTLAHERKFNPFAP